MPKTLPELADEFSEDELKEMLFGEDAIEEEPQPVEELPDRKKWIPSLSYKLGFGYSDNPMYGPYVREESGYLEMESELFRHCAKVAETYLLTSTCSAMGRGLTDCPNMTSPGFLWPKPNTPT